VGNHPARSFKNRLLRNHIVITFSFVLKSLAKNPEKLYLLATNPYFTRKNMKKLVLAVFCSAFAVSLCACSSSFFYATDTRVDTRANIKADPRKETFAQIKAEQRIYNAKLDRILLIHPQSREMVSCSSETLTTSGILSDSVEICAERVERLGFVRVTDIPRFTAPDDNFSHANYPSRRFRGTDPTPRW